MRVSDGKRLHLEPHHPGGRLLKQRAKNEKNETKRNALVAAQQAASNNQKKKVGTTQQNIGILNIGESCALSAWCLGTLLHPMVSLFVYWRQMGELFCFCRERRAKATPTSPTRQPLMFLYLWPTIMAWYSNVALGFHVKKMQLLLST